MIQQLLKFPMTRNGEGWLVVPRSSPAPGDTQVRVPLPHEFCREWDQAFDKKGGGFILAVPIMVEGVEDHNRDLHTKAVMIEGETETLLAIGSSNFTPHGMGVGVYNLEANLAFLDRSDETRQGLMLVDRLALPIPWTQRVPAREVAGDEKPPSPEDEPASRPAVPLFFSWASYSRVDGRLQLELRLDLTKTEPKAWSVRLPSSQGGEGLLLFESTSQGLPKDSRLIFDFPAKFDTVHPAALLVVWAAEEGQSFWGYLGISVEPDILLPPEVLRNLSPDTILECLISGKFLRGGTGNSQMAPVRQMGGGRL